MLVAVPVIVTGAILAFSLLSTTTIKVLSAAVKVTSDVPQAISYPKTIILSPETVLSRKAFKVQVPAVSVI